MGFASLIAGQVQNAMRILGDEDGLAPAQTYVVVEDGAGTYNVETGRMEPVYTEYPGVQMVLSRFKIDEMDDEVQPTTDRKVLIAANDLPGVTPTVSDVIVLQNGMVYEVNRILGIPGEGAHILHVRFNMTALPS